MRKIETRTQKMSLDIPELDALQAKTVYGRVQQSVDTYLPANLRTGAASEVLATGWSWVTRGWGVAGQFLWIVSTGIIAFYVPYFWLSTVAGGADPHIGRTSIIGSLHGPPNLGTVFKLVDIVDDMDEMDKPIQEQINGGYY